MPDNERTIVPAQRLGRLPRKSTRQALQFSDFFKFVDLPKSSNFWSRRAKLPLRTFGNTEHGSCTRSKQAVAAMRMERLEQKRTISITDDEVLRVYYAMTERLYGGGDTGAYEDDALNEWRNPDLTFKDTTGHPYTIDAYLRINPANQDELRAGIALAKAKGIAICLNLPAAFASIVPPKPWDIPEGQQLMGEWMPGSWGGHCAASETPIPLMNGETVPIADLCGQKDLWVYGCLPSSQPVPACAREVVRTKRSDTVRVHVDLGPPIRTTADHLWMLRDGTYRRAADLQPGDRLMPLRRITHHRGYEKVKWYDGRKRQAFTHRMVAEMVHGAGPLDVTDHDDENKRNNHPSNLILRSQGEHVRRHQPWLKSTGSPGWFSTPAGREWLRQPRSAEWREAMSARLRHARTSEPCGFCGVPVERPIGVTGPRFCSRDHYLAARWGAESVNHKVVAVEPGGEDWVYDLLDVNPTNNFAAGSVFIHNSLHCHDYTADGIVIDHTWNLPPQVVTWRAVAAYLDEAHLIIDSVNSWRKDTSSRKVKSALADVVDAVNAVSAIRIDAK